MSPLERSPYTARKGRSRDGHSTILVEDPLRGPRIPPQDLEAEKALLGSLLLSSDAMFEIADLCTTKSFYAAKHQIIFEVVCDLVNKKEPVDILTVSSSLRNRKEFDQIGGAQYLSELLGLVGSAANVKYYAQIIRRKELLRRLIEASTHIAEISYDESEDIENVLEEAEKRIYEVTTSGGTSNRLIAFQELIEETWSRIEKLSENGGTLRGVPSGFKDLDNKLSGFQKSDLIILAARPSVGKTSLALDFARHAAVKHNIPTAIFSLEMSKEQLVDRMLSAQSQVDGFKLRNGKLTLDEEFSRLQQGMHELMKAPLYIDDKAANTIMNMRSVLRRLNTERPIGLIIVDYLQLMGTAKSYDNMVNQVTEISRSLKALAKEFNAPVIALSQLSRAVESRGGRPRLSDLRDSGSIEQDADAVLFIHREDKYGENNEKKNVVEILIEKHRNGPTGIVELYFDDKKTSFLPVEKSEFGDFVLPNMNTPEF
ncbi:MAG: replicative helicase, replicative helicase [Candidatus Nomurabacteria bacterium]|nr:replicative helicase, replicative helicase [Candidatus Nomurabacteria bacterium]